MPWFRVSLSASQSLLADAAPLCQGLAKYAGFDNHESAAVGDALLAAIHKAQTVGPPEALIDVVCQVDASRFEARVTRGGHTVDTVDRPLTKVV